MFLDRILFARRMMQIWYSWKGGREGEFSLIYHAQLDPTVYSEKTLMTVLKKQRAKVEEIKKKTNYYSTRNLLEKYDEQSSVTPSATPIRRRSVAPSAPPTPLQLKPQQQQHPHTPNGQTQVPPLQLSRASLSSTVSSTLELTWEPIHCSDTATHTSNA